MQVGAIIATAGLFDAAYSGDWSRIGAISVDTEDLLKQVCKLVVAERAFLTLYVYLKRDEQEKDELPWTLAKAILAGTVGVYKTLK